MRRPQRLDPTRYGYGFAHDTPAQKLERALRAERHGSTRGRQRVADVYRADPTGARKAVAAMGWDGSGLVETFKSIDRAAARGITLAELAAEDAERARQVLGTTEAPEASTDAPERGPEPPSDDERAAAWYRNSMPAGA